MPRPIALLIYLGVVVWLFRRDFREKPNVTGALWIPLIWLFIITSRPVSFWLAIFGLNFGGGSLEEGSPMDALAAMALIVAGLRVLVKRHVTLSEIIRNNRWLVLFFVYCFLAVFWSDYPFVAFKRWIKILGHPIMVLVLFTEPDFEVALTTLMKRCAYVIVPISTLFIKYFREYGVQYSSWTGQPSYSGITLGKNELGTDSLIFGLFFFWYWQKVLKMEKSKFRRNELILCVAFLSMLAWQLHMASSSTSLVSLFIAILLLVVLGFSWIRKEQVGSYVLIAIVFCAIGEFVFGLSDVIIGALGKDPTLTDRTEVWADCLKIPINPILGAGFESFWLGDRLEIMWAKWFWHPNQAHNGYLEMYLNLGLVGLFIMLGMIFATFFKARRELLVNFHFGRLRIAFVCALVLYNWTEASFKALHAMWFFFYIIAIDYPKANPQLASEPDESSSEDPVKTDLAACAVDQRTHNLWPAPAELKLS